MVLRIWSSRWSYLPVLADSAAVELSAPMTQPTEELAAAVRKLVGQVAHWTPSRWAASSACGASGGVPGRARADVMHELVQWLAARAAEAEGQPRRAVPRLDNDRVRA